MERYSVHDPQLGIARSQTRGIHSRIVHSDNLMVSVCRIDPHTNGDLHSHPEEQWGFMLDGNAVRVQDGQNIPVTKGDFWCTPPNTPHAMYTTNEPCTVMDIFTPPRQCYMQPGTGYGT